MSIFNSINSSASALTAERLRMDTISSNMANADSTRAKVDENGNFEPYRRKMTSLQPQQKSFSSFLNQATGRSNQATGVKVSSITEDQTPFKEVYNPNHPDANEAGYVQMPNVDPLKEMTDLMSATWSYEANMTTLNSSKNMLMKALEIGK